MIEFIPLEARRCSAGFVLMCDFCKTETEARGRRSDVIELARVLGWGCVRYWSGSEHEYIHACTDCLKVLSVCIRELWSKEAILLWGKVQSPWQSNIREGLHAR